jgi:uncharacterized protein (TIGR02246 family)
MQGANKMNTKAANRNPWKLWLGLVLLAAMPLAMVLAPAAGADESANSKDDAAIKQIVADFSNGWNTHDAHAMCVSLAEKLEWVNWRGEALGTREAVEKEHAELFSDLYKNSHRTDEVKSINYLNPELAVVDDYWSMTGAKKRDGSDWPYRAGLYTFLMAKRNGRWLVIVSHAADFNAQTPGK